MRNSCVALLLLGWLSGAAYAQEQAPKLLVHAAQCLAAKKELPTSAATTLRFGYLIDAMSNPGKKVLYVVAAPGANVAGGRAFSIFFSQSRHRQIFDIQNGTTFVRSNDGAHRINFVVPPFGDTAAEEPFVKAIQQMEGQPMFTISGTDLVATHVHIVCKSYTDDDQP